MTAAQSISYESHKQNELYITVVWEVSIPPTFFSEAILPLGGKKANLIRIDVNEFSLFLLDALKKQVIKDKQSA